MKVADLIAHLQKLDPEAAIYPCWESHVPSDFGGLFRAMPDDPVRKWPAVVGAPDLFFLECEERGPVTWDVDPIPS